MLSFSDLCSSNWKWPDISGLHSFEGKLIHSAAWDHNADLAGKNVAVLGCGSSGVQIVPAILPSKIFGEMGAMQSSC